MTLQTVSAPSEYRIGTVATLTGLDPHTIRAWERRYGAVKPDRSETGRRLYGDAEVERLQLLKALVDCGEAIGSVAQLSEDDLRKRLHKMAGFTEANPVQASPVPSTAGAIRLGLLAPQIASQLRARPAGMSGFELRATRDRVDSFLDALATEPCDVLVLELERLGSEPTHVLEECLAASGAKLAVVIYTFARAGELARLARRSARLVRGPLRVDSLRRSVLDQMAISEARQRRVPPTRVPNGAAPERRFSDEQLARLAEAQSSVDCECPNHLSAIVSALVSFESYSRDCESLDDGDAAMHQELATTTGRARALMEELLQNLCEYEGISV